jgi:hypothetical protein
VTLLLITDAGTLNTELAIVLNRFSGYALIITVFCDFCLKLFPFISIG